MYKFWKRFGDAHPDHIEVLRMGLVMTIIVIVIAFFWFELIVSYFIHKMTLYWYDFLFFICIFIK